MDDMTPAQKAGVRGGVGGGGKGGGEAQPCFDHEPTAIESRVLADQTPILSGSQMWGLRPMWGQEAVLACKDAGGVEARLDLRIRCNFVL